MSNEFTRQIPHPNMSNYVVLEENMKFYLMLIYPKEYVMRPVLELMALIKLLVVNFDLSTGILIKDQRHSRHCDSAQ